MNLTKLGDILTILIPAATLGLSFFSGKDEAIKFVLAYALANGVCFVVKAATWANRPRTKLSSQIEWFKWSKDEGNSFPSGHTTSAMAGAVYAVFLNPYIGAGLLALALLCAYSRVKALAHFPRDVFFGAVTAQIVCGSIYWDIFNIIKRII